MLVNGILTREQQEAGLTVSEDEDMVFLEYKGHTLATWFSLCVKPAAIQAEGQVYLSELRKYSQLIIAGI
jgi:hypothetical protein